MTIDQVRAQYGSGPVKLADGSGGLPVLQVRTELGEADIYLHGAHVTHFRPAGHDPVLFMSGNSWFAADKPIRGGVPICCPWFGPKKDNPKAPAHGVFRLQTWTVQSITTLPTGEVGITLQLLPSDLSREFWPFTFEIEQRIRVGRELSMTLAMRNTDTEPFTFEEALHTYLAVGDVKQVSVSGLSGATYMDRLQNLQRFTQEGAIRFTGETDRSYLNTETAVTVDDPSMRRRIRVSKTGSKTTVVWNPWIAKAKAMPDFGDEEWPGMVCVETANAADNAVSVAPQETHLMQAAIAVEKA